MSAGSAECGRLAVVVFSGEAALCVLRLLRPGFRHCFVAVNDGCRWITVDSLAHRTEVAVLPVPPDYDLAAFYRRHVFAAFGGAPPLVPRRLAPLSPFTCVETVKRVLGIHARTVLTPWQLYRYISNNFLDNGTKA